MSRKIELILDGNARGLQRAVGQARHSTGLLGKSFHGLGKIAGIAGGALGIYGLVHTLEKSVHAALAAETAQKRLEVAFKNSHLSVKPYAEGIERVEKAARQLGFQDVETKQSLGSLLTATQNYGKAVKDLAVAQDTARFRGTDLVTTTKMIAQAMTGSQRAVKQLGLTISPVTSNYDALGKKASDAEKKQAKLLDKMATGDKIIATLSARVKGQGEAFAQTTQGGIERMRASLEHLEVTIGTLLFPVIQKFADFVTNKAAPAIEEFIHGIDFHAIGEQVRAPLSIATDAVKGFIATIGDVRRVVGPDIFNGLIIGILGAHGVLSAIQALKGAWVGLVALFGSGGPAALAFAGLAITIGGLAAVFLHNRSAALSLSDAYDQAAKSADDLNQAEENLKQSQLDVAQAHLRQKLAADQVHDAQVNLNRVISEYGKNSQQAKEASHQLTQAKLNERQANIDASKAENDHKQAVKDARKEQRDLANDVVKAAQKQRDYQSTLGATLGWVSKVTGGLSKNSAAYQDDNEKARVFADRMDKVAEKLKKTHPRLSDADSAVANLARSLGRIPSDTEIRFIVRTLSIAGKMPAGAQGPVGRAGGGRIPGAKVNADSVPAMLSPGEFVVTGGGEQMLEDMTFPGVLDWLQREQPPHFATGGRAATGRKRIQYDRLFYTGIPGITSGGASTRGLVPQVLHALTFARGHGWHGQVTSGWRSYQEQAALYARYLAGGPLAARPGTSSHERGQAVDVTSVPQFAGAMSIAPPNSRLYNFLGARDPVHWSVSGYRGGGRMRGYGIGGKIRSVGRAIGRAAGYQLLPIQHDHRRKGKIVNGRFTDGYYGGLGVIVRKGGVWYADGNRIPLRRNIDDWLDGLYGMSPARAGDASRWWHQHGAQVVRNASRPGRGRRGEYGGRFRGGGRVPGTPRWISAAEDRAGRTRTLDDDISAYEQEQGWITNQLGKKISKARRGQLRERMGDVQDTLRDLKRKRRTRTARKERRAERASRDYSQLPARIREKISKARYENDPKAELAALREGKAWLQKQLARRGLTHEQRAAIYDALDSISDDIKSLEDEANQPPEPSEDLKAQLEQERQRNIVLQRNADLANAFIATGVFGGGDGGGSGVGGPGGGQTFIFQSAWPPSPEIIRQVGAGAARGFGEQGYRPATRQNLGV